MKRVRQLAGAPSVAGSVACLVLVIACGAAYAEPRQLSGVAVSEIHDPLYIDRASVKRSGAQVVFRYVLDVPVALEAPAAERRWKSNEMEAGIDCARRTYWIDSVLAHSGPRATGNIVGSYSSTPAERNPAPIVPGSTFDFLARDVCVPPR